MLSRTASRRQSSRGRTPSGRPNPVDVHVGWRIRQRRTLLGFSQEQLGLALGLTFQQVQKYERGANRVSASRLFDLSNVLDVPVSFFFDGMSDEVAAAGPAAMANRDFEPGLTGQEDPMVKRETLELVRDYYAISNPAVRSQVKDLAKALAKSGTHQAAE